MEFDDPFVGAEWYEQLGAFEAVFAYLAALHDCVIRADKPPAVLEKYRRNRGGLIVFLEKRAVIDFAKYDESVHSTRADYSGFKLSPFIADLDTFLTKTANTPPLDKNTLAVSGQLPIIEIIRLFYCFHLLRKKALAISGQWRPPQEPIRFTQEELALLVQAGQFVLNHESSLAPGGETKDLITYDPVKWMIENKWDDLRTLFALRDFVERIQGVLKDRRNATDVHQ